MPDNTPTGDIPTAKVKKAARPWSGFFLGLILGLAVVVLIQQAGIWPFDQMLLWGGLGVFSLLGVLISGARRLRVGMVSSFLPLILAVGMIAYGAVGITEANEKGQLNGGCTLEATSPLDSIASPKDTSRQNPFEVDPEGFLEWEATSPVAFKDHTWKIWADVGGFKIPLRNNGDPNTKESKENKGRVEDLSAEVAEVTGAEGYIAGGSFKVGGDIKPKEGQGCDGFGFVRLVTDPLATLAAKIAAGLAILSLIFLLTMLFNTTRTAELVPEAGAGAAAAGGAATTEGAAEGEPSGAAAAPGGDEEGEEEARGGPEPGSEDLPDTDDLA